MYVFTSKSGINIINIYNDSVYPIQINMSPPFVQALFLVIINLLLPGPRISHKHV